MWSVIVIWNGKRGETLNYSIDKPNLIKLENVWHFNLDNSSKIKCHITSMAARLVKASIMDWNGATSTSAGIVTRVVCNSVNLNLFGYIKQKKNIWFTESQLRF